MINTDVLIVGSGVIGLSIARSVSTLGLDVILVEKERRSGESISSRNSGVIHAGMYYPSNSLKAKLCVKGNELLYKLCEEKNIDHQKIGKLIIASDKEEDLKLSKIYDQGKKNSVDLCKLTQSEVSQIEPNVKCYSAIYSPNTGIIDVPHYISVLEAEIQKLGVISSFETNFLNAEKKGNVFVSQLTSAEDFEIRSKYLINCTGLDSTSVAKSVKDLDLSTIREVYYGKGHYFKYSGERPFTKLIYPLPDTDGLGIHFSVDMAGQSKFGPDMEWVDIADYSFNFSVKEKFVKSIKRYWPDLNENKLTPDYSGIRPKIYKKNEKAQDFYISTPEDHKLEGFFNLQGIESPGLTSSLAIGHLISTYINGLK